MKDEIYRVVVVQGDKVIWASNSFFSSQKKALSYIERLASDDEEFYNHKTEPYKLNPWGRFVMPEPLHASCVTARLITNIIDDEDGYTATYGIVTYELD